MPIASEPAGGRVGNLLVQVLLAGHGVPLFRVGRQPGLVAVLDEIRGHLFELLSQAQVRQNIRRGELHQPRVRFLLIRRDVTQQPLDPAGQA